MQAQHGLSQRRACRLTGCNRETARHVARGGTDADLWTQLKQLAHAQPRWGYRLLWGALRQTGLVVNHKKVYRLYKEEHLELRRKGKKRLKSEGRGRPQPPQALGELCS